MSLRFARIPDKRVQSKPSWLRKYFSSFQPRGTCMSSEHRGHCPLIVFFRRGDTTFNKLPSNRHPDLTPAIAFVNYFCEVASLEPEIVPDVINVKRQVLSMLQVKEFSPVARFENPAPKLILPAVFCPLCSHGQDIDLCRDHGALSKAWRCSNLLMKIVRTRFTHVSLSGASIAVILWISTLCTACFLRVFDGWCCYRKLR